MCSKIQRKTDKIGYVRSPLYPENYKPMRRCLCNLTADGGDKIDMKFIDSSLEWSEGCRKDIIKVSDGDLHMPRCGRLPRNYNITSKNNRVQLYFKSDAWRQDKGFWVQIKGK